MTGKVESQVLITYTTITCSKEYLVLTWLVTNAYGTRTFAKLLTRDHVTVQRYGPVDIVRYQITDG
jgi:hypothetical protein